MPDTATATTPATDAPNVYADALASQGACNLGALVHGFSRTVTKLQAEAREQNKGTDWINTHPACVLFVEQLRHLTGYSERYSAAYEECKSKSNRNW